MSGKVQKYVLREKEWRGQSKRIHLKERAQS
jgi:hypothetical protein